MSEDDFQVESLKKQWGIKTEPLVALPLRTYSDLLILVGKLQGINFGAGLYLQQNGEMELGTRLMVEEDRIERRLSLLLSDQ